MRKIIHSVCGVNQFAIVQCVKTRDGSGPFFLAWDGSRALFLARDGSRAIFFGPGQVSGPKNFARVHFGSKFSSKYHTKDV